MLLDLDRPTFPCRILDLWYLGEHDPRIEVHSRDGPITVELLCPAPGNPAQPAWHAVRAEDERGQCGAAPSGPAHPRQSCASSAICCRST